MTDLSRLKLSIALVFTFLFLPFHSVLPYSLQIQRTAGAAAQGSDLSTQVLTGPRELEATKKRVAEMEKEAQKIITYLTGNISFLDNFSSDILLKFAETLFEFAELYHMQKILEYNAGGPEEEPPPKPDYQIPIRFLNELISARGFDEHIDSFYYLRAICFEEQGMPEKSADDYKVIVERFKFSTLFPETVFRLGEFYFDTGQIAMAIDTYSLNLNEETSEFYDKTLYKLGWSYFRARDYKKAIDYFLKVAEVAYGNELPQGTDQAIPPKAKSENFSRVNLADEALTYVALSYVNFGTPEEIEIFFELESKGYAENLLHKIGDAFSDQAKFDEAIVVYRNLIHLFSLSAGLPEVHSKIISIYEKTMNSDRNTFESKIDFIDAYAPGSAWFEHNKDLVNKSLLLNTLEEMIVDTAKYYLKTAKRRDDLSSYDIGISMFQKYIDIFKKSRRAHEMNYLLAEALYASQRYEKAVSEYQKSAWEYENKEFQEKSAYGVILAYEKIIGLEKKETEKGADTTQKMIGAIDRFLKEFPSKKISGTIRMKQGELFFNLGRYDEAVSLFNKARTAMGTTNQNVVATTFLADSFFNQKKYEDAEREYAALSKLAGAMSNLTLQKKADRQRVISILNQGDIFKKNGSFGQAAELFERAHRLSRSREESRFALGEAIKIYIETNWWSKFDNAVLHFQNRFSEKQRVVKFLIAAGKESDENFQFLQAAVYYEKASALTGEADKVHDYLLVSANSYQKAGSIEKAVSIFTRLSRLPDLPGKRGIEYLFRAGELLEKQNLLKESTDIYMDVITRHKTLTFRGKPGNSYYFAKSKFILLKTKLNAFLDQKLEHPFKESFKRKADMMKELMREYIEISRLEIHEFTSRSLFTIGQLFENFRDAILHSARPENLSKEESEEYTFMLEEKAFPYEENAEKTYTKNVMLARKKSVTNRFVDLSYRRLAMISPALFKREETVFDQKIFYPKMFFLDELPIPEKK